jgi:DNA-binding transcriptional ArsR family regulator
MTTVEIAERLAVSSTLVGQWLQQCNIDARPSGSGLDARGIVAPTAEELQRMVHEEYLSYAQIAERFGVDQSAVPHWLDKHGVDRSDVRETRWGGPIPDEDEILRLYSSGKSLRSIAKLYGVSKSTVRALCIEYGIPLRRDGFRHGQRFDCIDGHRVRSTYEKHVDDWLHRHGIEHVYEPILPCDTRYHADFRANGWYIEVWGVTQSETYDARKQRKIDLYLAHSIPLIEVPYYAFQTARKGLWKRLLAQCQQPPSTQYSLFPLEDLSS